MAQRQFLPELLARDSPAPSAGRSAWYRSIHRAIAGRVRRDAVPLEPVTTHDLREEGLGTNTRPLFEGRRSFAAQLAFDSIGFALAGRPRFLPVGTFLAA